MKTLHLTLKKKWYDMILSGEKKEEYREVKAYWFTRLIFEPKKVWSYFGHTGLNDYVAKRICQSHYTSMIAFNPYDTIIFTNGYSQNAPSFEIECKGIEIGHGLIAWGAVKNKEYFVIKLGNVLQSKSK